EADIDALVATCLDHGIRHFDTTYRPERIALGASLARLGRRAEARLIAWNFFRDFDDSATDLGGPEAYREEHLASILADLRTDHLDELVVHRVADPTLDAAQESLAVRWQSAGHVGRLGIWCPGPAFSTTPTRHAYAFVVEPRNAFTPAVLHPDPVEVYGTSPFVRGWQLDRLATSLPRATVADLLLRHAAFHPPITHLIVSMRRAALVAPNLASLARGPLSDAEQATLTRLLAA
ncbi:MAG: hypothetical protein H7067_08910, partial [Burkholderiales bacterium]|nr:hypothetical protein [Opitutaceae bacterium]